MYGRVSQPGYGAQPGTTIRDLIADVEAALRRRGRSENTITTYAWSFNHLLAFCEGAGVTDVGGITEELLEDWQDDLIARGLSPSSRSLCSTAVRALIKLGSRKKIMDRALEDAVEVVNVPAYRPRPLPDATLTALLERFRRRSRKTTAAELRDRALFLYLLTTGARVSEVLRIQRDDYERPIVVQKGGTEKALLPPPSTIAAVEDYLRVRADDLPELFVTMTRDDYVGPMNPRAVREVWDRLARQLGVPRWTTHQVRHTSATLLAAQGIGPLVLADHLGHHGLATVQNYAQVGGAARRQVVDIFESIVAPEPPPQKVLRLPLRKRRRRRR